MTDPNIWPRLRALARAADRGRAVSEPDDRAGVFAWWPADVGAVPGDWWQALRPPAAEHILARRTAMMDPNIWPTLAERRRAVDVARQGELMKLPDLERAAAAVHASWCVMLRRGGATSSLSETGEELLRAYPELSEAAKDVSRNMVRVVYVAIAVTSREPVELPDYGPLGQQTDPRKAAIGHVVPPDVAAAFPEPPDGKRSFPPRPRPSDLGAVFAITPEWVEHACPSCQRALLIDRLSLTVIRASDLAKP